MIALAQPWQTGLPKPRYTVELIVERKKHLYKVNVPGTSVETGPNDGPLALPPYEHVFPGVTGVLSVINKPALVNWSRKSALEAVRAQLLERFPSLALTTKGRKVGFNLVDIDEILAVAAKRPDQLKDDAADLGTKAHAYIDTIVKGGKISNIPDDILTPVMAFAEWWDGSGMEFLSGDLKVASLEHGYGGSLDALGIRGSTLVLLDWKTSKALYDEYALQVAAYAKAFEEMYGVVVEEAVCVRFRKDGVRGVSFEALKVRNIDESFQAFLAAKDLSERMKLEHFVR